MMVIYLVFLLPLFQRPVLAEIKAGVMGFRDFNEHVEGRIWDVVELKSHLSQSAYDVVALVLRPT